MRSVRLLALVLAVAASPVSRVAAATVASVFAAAYRASRRDGVQFCQGKVGARVESFDGVPLDVDVTLPPADQNGPFPLIVDLLWLGPREDGHPVRGPGARGIRRRQLHGARLRGVVRVACLARVGRHADVSDACVKRGWIRLADARYEAHDTQQLAGLLADEGLVSPDRVGVTGASYGGGQSLILAALHDRVMLPDGTLVPWKSPGGLDMTIAAAAPLIPWSDLAQALTPNGRTLDYRVDNPYGMRAGVQKKSWRICSTAWASPTTTRRRAPIPRRPARVARAHLAGRAV